MANVDRLKEEIGLLKLLGGFVAALIVSVITWLVRNYETSDPMVTVAASAVAAVIAVGIVAAVVRLYRCFKLLEES